jgi:hypothetical protein
MINAPPIDTELNGGSSVGPPRPGAIPCPADYVLNGSECRHRSDVSDSAAIQAILAATPSPCGPGWAPLLDTKTGGPTNQCWQLPSCPPGYSIVYAQNDTCALDTSSPGSESQGAPAICPPGAKLTAMGDPASPGVFWTCQQPGVCPPPYLVANGLCVLPANQPPTPPNRGPPPQPPCPPGQRTITNACCPAGSTPRSDGGCTRFGIPKVVPYLVPACLSGERLPDGRCAPVVCGPGSVFRGDACVSICPAGAYFRDGRCETEARPGIPSLVQSSPLLPSQTRPYPVLRTPVLRTPGIRMPVRGIPNKLGGSSINRPLYRPSINSQSFRHPPRLTSPKIMRPFRPPSNIAKPATSKSQNR